MARAMLFEGAGRPFRAVDGPEPMPRGTEVMVRVVCCTLCRSDLHTQSGRRIEPMPTVLGHEIVGRITAFGPEASAVDGLGTPAEVGSRITWSVAVGCGSCHLCQVDLPQKCVTPYKYGHVQVDPHDPYAGGLAEYVRLVPKTAWYVVPENLTDEVAAMANCATATVAGLIRHAGPLKGQSVTVLGAGVLGVTAAAITRAAGAETILVVDPIPANQERARSFGATHVANPETASAALMEATRGRGADMVFELAGPAESAALSLRLARIGGQVIWAGTVAPTAPLPIEPEQIVRRMLTIRGIHNYHPRDLAAALQFLAGPGQTFPFGSLVREGYGLDSLDQAFRAAEQSPGTRIAIRP